MSDLDNIFVEKYLQVQFYYFVNLIKLHNVVEKARGHIETVNVREVSPRWAGVG